ncbi:hypothetical protein BSL78_26846 [Apostichopus japonicus]|uniref:Uncharacterized protein n=1 Tax=Stichopus japonicus TaxID=307972 RepID=A0A2G8JKP6_STIJA|nr:hypothetical protein BSL78_26846 [Apostichopus japonicus]
MEEEPPTGRLRNDERELRSQTECQDSLNDTLPANGDCSSLEHTTPSHDKRSVVEGKQADLLVLKLPKVSGERSSCEEQESANEPIELRSYVGNEEKEEEPFPSRLKIKESELRSHTECQDSLKDTLPANADCSSLGNMTPLHDKRSVVEGKQADLMVLKPPEDSGEGSSCEEQLESENEPIELRSDVGNEEKDEEKFPSSFKIKERELRSQTESKIHSRTHYQLMQIVPAWEI